MLADEPARGQDQEQLPEPGRADRSAMSLHRWLAVVFVLLALAEMRPGGDGAGLSALRQQHGISSRQGW